MLLVAMLLDRFGMLHCGMLPAAWSIGRRHHAVLVVIAG